MEIRIVTTSIQWNRSVLTLQGKYSGAGLDGAAVYLKEYNTQNIIYGHVSRAENGVFLLQVRMLSACGQYPLPTGEWYLTLRGENGREQHAGAAQELVLSQDNTLCEHDRRIATGANDSFTARMKRDPDTGALYIKVVLKVPFKQLSRSEKNERKRSQRRTERNVWLFDSVFYFFSKFKKRGNRVLFTSDSRGSLGGNLEFVYRGMLAKGLDKQYKFRFSFKDNLSCSRTMYERLKYVYYMGTSDIIFLDDFQPVFYRLDFDSSVKIVQLWHACGAFKTVGLERSGQPGGASVNTRHHKCYTHMTVSSELSRQHYAEAFGLDESKILPIGVARIDMFFDQAYKEKAAQAVRDALHLTDESKKVILYAPTFRGNGSNTAWFPMQFLDWPRLAQHCRDTNSVFIIKMHPFVKTPLNIPENCEDVLINASGYREVNDILFVADVLVTDYSSVIYEFSLLGRPMLFYAFDENRYVEQRGFYEPYKDMVPGKIVKTFDDLLQSLQAEAFEFEKVDAFVKKNFTYVDGNSTDRIIDAVIFNKLPGTKDVQDSTAETKKALDFAAK